jgi:GntR family transcriptional regulator
MRLAKIVREQISEGLLPPGQAVPSITALCAEHQIARGTARQAMLLLEDDGLIYRVPGLGYHVCGA